MKTKEQLKDIKLFADFIGDDLSELSKIDEDTKQEVVTDYYNQMLAFYNPQGDWNLLHEAYNKARIIYIDKKNDDNLKWILKVMETALILNANISLYEDILSFIKYYNQVYTSTNNNQS